MTPGNKAFPWGFVVIVAFCVAAAVFWLAGPSPFWSYTKSVERFEGRFYRVVVDFKYKGEPQTFDFTVGCNVKYTRYQDNSKTEEIGLIPAIYGRRMKNGKAVVVRPPNACYGQTTDNNLVPETFIPLITVYDSDTLEEGLAYVTEDAYHSPRAELSLPVTRIHASSREAFDKETETGIPNLVTRDLYWSKQGQYQAMLRGAKPMQTRRSDICRFALRYRLSEKARKIAARFWPASKPRYWHTENYMQRQAILGDVFMANGNIPAMEEDYVEPQPRFAPFYRHSMRYQFRDADLGIPTISGRFAIAHNDLYAKMSPPPPGIIAHYPIFSPVSPSHWPSSIDEYPTFIAGLKDPAFRDIRIEKNEFLGFAFCWMEPILTTAKEVEKLEVDSLGKIEQARRKALIQVGGHTTVDGVRVFTSAGRTEPTDGNYSMFERFFFESDEFAFELLEIDNDVVGGDVR